ncbi:hypothetical protein [Sphingopyxis sp.]|uniref:hypothetical protein n=1 Tax=Sphingopyxis sp. TaxID=1908224 RepID=UPI001D3D0761|nr:hypothetical protein [Sphingopyxis sp.]MBW8294490.1 hypothetical protein [Sphingopyxis sp.]
MARNGFWYALPLGVAAGILGMIQFGENRVIENAPASEQIADDGRTAVEFTGAERQHIRGEMLGFLNGSQSILDASLTADRQTIKTVASGLAKGKASPLGQAVKQKSPPEFTQLSQGLRQSFGAIALTADTASMAEIQGKLNSGMQKCAACHSGFKAIERNPK